MKAGSAWYVDSRERFIGENVDAVVGRLASNAASQGLHIETEQHDEWKTSIGVLQRELVGRQREIELIKRVLASGDFKEYRYVILEYDFRRRGLRMDCVLLGDGIIVVIEFKRTKAAAADREQASTYCINLVEFHEETYRLTRSGNIIVVPLIALTGAAAPRRQPSTMAFNRSPWESVVKNVAVCDAESLGKALLAALKLRRGTQQIDCQKWLDSRFAPSSTIIDASISLYGSHDVSAISAHAAPAELIDRCTAEVALCVEKTIRDQEKRIIFISGSPGAGKTLVGLKLTFDLRFRADAVFVTGNSPLVDVLHGALKSAYRKRQSSKSNTSSVLSGYSREDVQQVIKMSTYKIVKAHSFLGQRGEATNSTDGRVVIFDEAQRTYQAGREVLRKRLEADEAELILGSLERSYGKGIAVVALVGHNQAINRGELGISAWFKAADAKGWRYAISDETLGLAEIASSDVWALHANRERLETGHLPHSLRYYRNSDIERWAEHVLNDNQRMASEIAATLDISDTIWISRELDLARNWARERRVGDEKAGLIASGQARRLAAEGLFVDLKPDIAKWMLSPAGDIRSANMLETVQNQYQIQGLEIDYTIVCWDADLRRECDRWVSYKLTGSDWTRDSAVEIAKNGYRVLLTRARKGMVIFVPRGDASGEDPTRQTEFYDGVAAFLQQCGAKPIG